MSTGGTSRKRNLPGFAAARASSRCCCGVPLGAYTFTLDVVPNGVGGRLQTLEIFFNYFRVGFFEVTEPRTVSGELPAEIFILRKTRINLHCRNAVTPSEHGIPDDRRLGIAVSGWCIT